MACQPEGPPWRRHDIRVQPSSADGYGPLGVVFGDIGTSPLYTLSACLAAMLLQPTAVNLHG
ncbi:KUP/HAK/KT family potassium transporter [Acidithiobacillus ferriphilus]|uniref:KUP/HAK/KT family potassium transporter n=1 Tax=Acidithiobacillus ferriphilus TaxID=1689834 RepID=UPI002DBB1AD4|nr:KUP/HAK/KT family potassium transporter [Acidithiobacillus ferriphilus]MEB8537299.1 KUP/HAK/KT family potassium transporter [Acidithiobacillus ferriphilus]